MECRMVRRELNVPDDRIVICGLLLGHPDPDVVPNRLITERRAEPGFHDLKQRVTGPS